jgi:hypothetical protein
LDGPARKLRHFPLNAPTLVCGSTAELHFRCDRKTSALPVQKLPGLCADVSSESRKNARN